MRRAGLILANATSLSGVRGLDIIETRSAFAGAKFGSVGRYEHILGRLFCELDPRHGHNSRIVDLDVASRNSQGYVEYQVDFEILKPVNAERGNKWLLYEAVNRGNKLSISRFNCAVASNRLDREADAGDGLLMRRGFTVLWSGWQGDLLPGADRILANLPVIAGSNGAVVGTSREEFIAEASGLATDEFIRNVSDGRFIGRLTYPAATRDASTARLTIRQLERDPRVTPSDLVWRYIDDRHIEISRPSGFDHGAIYEFVYQARDPIAMGVGLVSIRDVVSFFSSGSDDAGNPNPLRQGAIAHTLAFGASQSGRVIRDFVYEGFNQSLAGSRVFDAILPVVTGSRRSFVNARFAQPGRYSRQHEDHVFPGDQFPFTYPTLTDPISGRTDGILARAVEAGVCPKVMHLDADTELWAGRGSLLVTDCTGTDVAMPDTVRVFLAAGVPHANAAPAKQDVVQQRHNPLGYTMTLRALLIALVEWVEHDIEPPASCFPSRAAGTLVTLDDLRRAFPSIRGVVPPSSCNALALTDHSVQPPIQGQSYPVYVGSIDSDGNTVGGVRLPLISVPVATATGWNLRAKGYAEGDLYSIHGSVIPFARTASDRRATQDPRLSLAERYESHQTYVKQLSIAAAELVRQRLLLQDDVDYLLERAAKGTWDINDLV